MKTMEILFPGILIAFVLFILGAGTFYYGYDMTVMRFPYMVGALLLVLGGIRFARALRGQRLEGELPYEEETPTTEGLGEFLRTALWLLGILPAVWILGYLAGIPVYLLIYLKAHGESWLTSVLLALAGLGVVYFVFLKFLKVLLPIAPIGFS